MTTMQKSTNGFPLLSYTSMGLHWPPELCYNPATIYFTSGKFLDSTLKSINNYLKKTLQKPVNEIKENFQSGAFFCKKEYINKLTLGGRVILPPPTSSLGSGGGFV